MFDTSNVFVVVQQLHVHIACKLIVLISAKIIICLFFCHFFKHFFTLSMMINVF